MAEDLADEQKGKYLQENLGNNLIIGITEINREDDNDTIALRLDEHRLLVAVLDVNRIDGLASFNSLENLLKGTSQEVTLQQTNLLRQRCWKQWRVSN